MDYNYHTHTSWCRHAAGNAADYVARAVECGIKHMGFSEHSPFVFPDGHDSGYRILPQETPQFIAEIEELRRKYQGIIDIKIGYELECYPKYFGDMVKKAVECGAEYLILGHHFLGNEHPNGFKSMQRNTDEALLKEYVNSVLMGIKSGVFTYVAHPDIFNFRGDEKLYRNEMRKICIASKKYNVPLEINFLGIRESRNYPRDDFWAIAGKVGAPGTFGFDAHSPLAAYDGESQKTAEDMVKRFGLNYIGKPELVLLKELKAQK